MRDDTEPGPAEARFGLARVLADALAVPRTHLELRLDLELDRQYAPAS